MNLVKIDNAQHLVFIFRNTETSAPSRQQGNHFYRMNIISELLMFNGHRAGVVGNMTIKDWQDGEWVDDCYSVTASYQYNHHLQLPVSPLPKDQTNNILAKILL